MKRKAILIESSDVKGQKDLPGARVDIDNWTLFLKSENGGAWKQSEIAILRKPFSNEVKALLDANKDSYCFVAFSGHGSNGAVVLNDHIDSFAVENLMPQGERGVLIVDSCRGFSGARQYNFSTGGRLVHGKMGSFANESRERILASNAQSTETFELLENRTANVRHYYASSAFITWTEALKNSNRGVLKMYSCSAGQAAGEDPESGGYYTSLLLEGAEVWVKAQYYSAVYSTKQAHRYAAERLPSQQVPEYTPLTIEFPFAAK